MNTCDTMVWVHGMLQCAKIGYCTSTYQTHDLKPMGFPVPMMIPTHKPPTPLLANPLLALLLCGWLCLLNCC